MAFPHSLHLLVTQDTVPTRKAGYILISLFLIIFSLSSEFCFSSSFPFQALLQIYGFYVYTKFVHFRLLFSLLKLFRVRLPLCGCNPTSL